MVTVDGCLSFWRDGPYLHIDSVSSGLEVVHAMVVSTRAVPVLSTATEVAAGEAKPQVVFEVALLAVGQRLVGDLLCACLIEGQGVLAWLQLEFPLPNSRRLERRLCKQDGVNQWLDLCMFHIKEDIALEAVDLALGSPLVRLGVDSARLADGELRDLCELPALVGCLLDVQD